MTSIEPRRLDCGHNVKSLLKRSGQCRACQQRICRRKREFKKRQKVCTLETEYGKALAKLVQYEARIRELELEKKSLLETIQEQQSKTIPSRSTCSCDPPSELVTASLLKYGTTEALLKAFGLNLSGYTPLTAVSNQVSHPGYIGQGSYGTVFRCAGLCIKVLHEGEHNFQSDTTLKHEIEARVTINREVRKLHKSPVFAPIVAVSTLCWFLHQILFV